MVEERLLDIQEVAGRLGVDDSTVYRLVKEGVLPGFKLGGQWRFGEKMLETWMVDQVNQTRLEADKQNGADSHDER